MCVYLNKKHSTVIVTRNTIWGGKKSMRKSAKGYNIALLKGTKGDIERQREMRQNEIINAGAN